MCIDLFLSGPTKSGLTFSQLANVQTVGIGLYLALAIVQAISSTGVGGLARRVMTLRNAVTSRRINPEIDNVRRLGGAVSGLEISFHDFNRRLLALVFGLFLIGLIFFVYCTLEPNTKAGLSGVWFTIAFYIALPITLFSASTTVIWVRCKNVAQEVKEAETRIRRRLVGLP